MVAVEHREREAAIERHGLVDELPAAMGDPDDLDPAVLARVKLLGQPLGLALGLHQHDIAVGERHEARLGAGREALAHQRPRARVHVDRDEAAGAALGAIEHEHPPARRIVGDRACVGERRTLAGRQLRPRAIVEGVPPDLVGGRVITLATHEVHGSLAVGEHGPRVGSPAGGYIVSHSANVLGHKRARELWMLCRRYNAQQALDWGLVNSVVPKEKLDEEVRKYADELLSLSPTCLRIVKRSFYHHMQPIMARDMKELIEEVAPNYFQTGEQMEGATAFLEKRKPDFSRFR